MKEVKPSREVLEEHTKRLEDELEHWKRECLVTKVACAKALQEHRITFPVAALQGYIQMLSGYDHDELTHEMNRFVGREREHQADLDKFGEE